MMTVDMLREYGANVDEGLARCMKNEAIYLRLVKMAVDDPGFDKLKDALADGDLAAAFDAVHGLKGILGNLSLTPLYDVACEMTEPLRSQTEMDYSPALDKLLGMQADLKRMAE